MLLRRFTLRARFVLAMVITTVSLSILGAWGVIANQVGIQKVASLFEQSNAANEAVAQLRESIGQLRLMQGVVVLFVQIGALSPETQYPCGFPAGATLAR